MQPVPSVRSRRPGAPARWGAAVLVAATVVGVLGAPAVGQDAPTTTVPPISVPPTVVDRGDPPKTPEELAEAKAALLETLDAAPAEQPASPDDPFAEVAAARHVADLAALARIDITQRSTDANVRALEAAEVLQRASRRVDAATRVRDAASKELATERRRLSDLTVQAYVTGGDVAAEQYRAYLEGDTTDPAAGRQIMFSQVLERQRRITEAAEADLARARGVLRRARAVEAAAEAEAAKRMAIAAELTRQRASLERAHLEALRAVEDADHRLRGASAGAVAPVPLEVAIIGLPRLEPEDLASWFEAGPWRPRVATPIEDYARWFIEEGRTEGIRGDIAFVQAVLETGGFTNTDSVVGNNFSGIGHYDNLPLGWTFPSPRLGVRAQIQLLKSYAMRTPPYANPLVDRRLRGPAGCCPTWGDLTTVWATDPTYGPKVMLLYSSLVEHALERRARGDDLVAPVDAAAGPAAPAAP